MPDVFSQESQQLERQYQCNIDHLCRGEDPLRDISYIYGTLPGYEESLAKEEKRGWRAKAREWWCGMPVESTRERRKREEGKKGGAKKKEEEEVYNYSTDRFYYLGRFPVGV
jgi:hypothetical protein